MLKKLIIVFVLISGGLKAGVADSLFHDDPVAAMLDSLAHNSYITRIPKVPQQRNNIYGFAPDSVPHPSVAVIQQRLNMLDAQSPFDLGYIEEVQPYIDLYAYKRRGLVERMLGLSQLYYPIFEEKLDQYNLPLELKHLAVIESALNPTATSRAGARGLWQFMYATGKMYDLEITSYVDERCDPYKSTVAACEFLQYLYSVYGDWQICLAAYNAGPGNINKAIRRAGGGKKTYWEIRPYLPRETQAYVPAFIAAAYIMTYHQEHNLYAIAPRATFYDVDSVNIKQELNFSQVEAILGIQHDQLTFLNPMYKLGVIPVGLTEPYHIILPNDQVGNFVMNEEKIYNVVKTDSVLAAMTVQQIQKTHTVKKGEHINTIAKKYKVSPDEIRTWNNLTSNTLRTGQKLTIWQPVPVESPSASASNTTTSGTNTQTTAVKDPPKTEAKTNTSTASSGTATYKYYTVKKGDSLWSIAQAHGTTVEELKRLNGFGSKVVLHVGDKIKLKKL
jgi:membrane-bound lytic murein transglycosylase D